MTAKRYRYYFEDFPVGRVLELGSRSLTEQEIIAFAREYDPQPFHVDEAAASASMFGGIIASGWQTCGVAMRLVCDGLLLDTASLGSPGVDVIRWLKPVRPGDALRMSMHVLEARRSTSKPDRGAVRSRWEMHNQHGELVMTLEGINLITCRNPA